MSTNYTSALISVISHVRWIEIPVFLNLWKTSRLLRNSGEKLSTFPTTIPERPLAVLSRSLLSGCRPRKGERVLVRMRSCGRPSLKLRRTESSTGHSPLCFSALCSSLSFLYSRSYHCWSFSMLQSSNRETAPLRSASVNRSTVIVCR